MKTDSVHKRNNDSKVHQKKNRERRGGSSKFSFRRESVEYICGSEPSVQRFLELAVERSRRWRCGGLYWKIVLDPKCLLFLVVGTVFGGKQHKIAMISTLVGVGSLAIWIPPLVLVSFFRG